MRLPATRALAALLGSLTFAACGGRPQVITATPAPAPAAPPTEVAAVPVDTPQKPPTLPAPKALTLPPIVTRTLPNGMRLMVVEHHELPLADFVLLVRTGHEADPPRHAGLAALASAMLDEGAGRRNALQIADQAAFLGVQLSTGSSWDLSSVSLHTPTAQLDSALALFADVALRPAFPQAELDRLRQERVTRIIQNRDQPTVIADQVYNALLFGAEHPYGRPTIGTEASLKQITRADVRTFYDRYYRPNNATLIVVGDVSPADVERKVTALFGGWQRRDVPAVNYGRVPGGHATTVYLVDKPGAAQSSFRIGSIGVARATEDYFPLQVMNTILGGSFTSRLNNTLREVKGYTYGAGSGFSMRAQPGPFTARSEIVAAKTDSALLEFMRELRGIRDTVPTAELEKVKRYLTLQLPNQFETTGDIAQQLIPLAVYGLPLDYYNAYTQRIQAVTQADVQRVARRYLDPERLSIVIVGDRKSIEPGLRATKVGTVEVRGANGEVVSP
ncbi:MAG TPA: pitrilysin family protein [Gemmatimonadaceae bacterium]|nr:pitrilysin family protein [Gemmatimonadaceae bacterium]